MLQLRDIMTRDVVTVAPDLTLRDAAALLAERHLSGAPVVDGPRVVGVVSMTDVLDFQASTSPVPAERADQVEWGGALEEPEEEMESVAPGQFYTDLFVNAGADLSERLMHPGSPEWDLLGEHTVAEVMSRRLHALPPDAGVDRAAAEMQRARVHRVLVMDGDRLLGIVTAMDVARAVAEHRVTVRRYVFDRRGGDEDRESEF